MKRRIHAYGVGTLRSGTSSMGEIFSSHYRTEHEPDSIKLDTAILAMQKGLITKQEFRRYVIYLDKNRNLEFNSSFLNSWSLDVLVDDFPDAKFILTIRDCYSWLNSLINYLFFKHHPSYLIEHKMFFNKMLGKGPIPSGKKSGSFARTAYIPSMDFYPAGPV